MPSRSSIRYHADLAAGICPRCRKPNDGPQSRCSSCVLALRAADKRRSAALKLARRCVDCRADLSMFGEWAHVRCFECHERNRSTTEVYNTTERGRQRHRKRMAALYQQRRASGLCARCEAPSPDRMVCDECLGKVKAARARYLDRKEAACAP